MEQSKPTEDLFSIIRKKVIERFPQFNDDEVNEMVFMLTKEVDRRISNDAVTNLNNEMIKKQKK